MMVLSLAFPHISGAHGEKLGEVYFSTSARSAQAQAHFLKGVKYLHSFGFEEAVEAIQRPMP
jgi:hypothetical protein